MDKHITATWGRVPLSTLWSTPTAASIAIVFSQSTVTYGMYLHSLSSECHTRGCRYLSTLWA